MRIKLILKPLSKAAILPVSYNYFLTGLIYKFLSKSSTDYSAFLHEQGYRLQEDRTGFKLFTYSMLMSEKMKVTGGEAMFGRGPVTWLLSSPVADFLQHLVTGVFAQGHNIKIGPEEKQETFMVESVETVKNPEYRDTLKFTCLSPITVSKPAGMGRPCHYLRPWEDGFSEAVKNNLLNKYSLVHGRDLNGPEFNIKIDAAYMNRKSGKITKKINFKGTEIIGFMAPFEVTGSPELIGTGYEAGFGEKGSMGFGMVREVVKASG